jgi:L-fuculose-phosphate aldolase
MDHTEILEKLIWAGKVLVDAGQDDLTRGHISVRVPGEPYLFFMKPHGVGLDEITHENVLTIDLDGHVVAGNARRHREAFIHCEVFRARPDVQSVVHTHPPYAVAWSAHGRSLRAYSQPGALFHDSTGLYDDTMALIRTKELGEGVARALGGKRCVLLKNHGVVVTGGSIEEAVVGTIMLENAAMIQSIVEAAGQPAPEFPPAQIIALKREIGAPDQFRINFDYLLRRARRRRIESAD